MAEKVIQLARAEAVPNGATFGVTPLPGIALRAGWQDVVPGSTVVVVDEAFAARCARDGILAAEEAMRAVRQAFLDEGRVSRLEEIASRRGQALADREADRLLAAEYERQARQAVQECRPAGELDEIEGWIKGKREDARRHEAQVEQLERMLAEEREKARQVLRSRLQAAAAQLAAKHAELAAKAEAEALAAFEPLWKERLANQAVVLAVDRRLVEDYLGSVPMPGERP